MFAFLRSVKTQPITTSQYSGWQLAVGRVDEITAPKAWRDEGIVIINATPAISPGRRYLVVGDLWLSNRARLHSEDNPSESDSEIIARLWERSGSDTVRSLQGKFAFAVWDRERAELTLVRDRVGARTLYYSRTGTTRWIAPQLRGLRAGGELDLVALRDYLCCAFVPGDRTMWRDIRELRPGTIFNLTRAQASSYWQVSEQIEGAEEPLEWHGVRLRACLEEVVNEYLPPRRDVGAYLSGGLDSSCIVALAARLHSEKVHTFSIHFGNDLPNELEFSSLVAQHCRSAHNIIEITPDDMWSLLPETMAYLDDPIGDPLTVPNLILGRAANRSVNVILNGEGGDPCFGGPKNQPMLLTNLYQPAVDAHGIINSATPDVNSAYLASFQKCSQDLPRLMNPEVWARVCDEPTVFAEDLSGTASYINRLMFINTKFKGADHILTKVNNLTRAAGVEGRSPLFDQRVVALSVKIPPHYKLSGVQEKAVLKAAVRDLLPESIISRPKSGMMVPVQLWFRKHWQRAARALLLSRRARIRPYLDQTLIKDWLNYRGDTWGRYGVKLWLLVSLELWLQAHQRD